MQSISKPVLEETIEEETIEEKTIEPVTELQQEACEEAFANCAKETPSFLPAVQETSDHAVPVPEKTPRPWDAAMSPKTVEETITCYVGNDVGNARRFLDACGDQVGYCAEEEQWYVYNGVQWQAATHTQIERMAYQALEESYLREAVYFQERNTFGYMDGLQKQTAKRGIDSGNARTIKDCVNAAEFLNIIKPEDFNTDPYWFHVKNGAIYLKPNISTDGTDTLIHIKVVAFNKPEHYFNKTAGTTIKEPEPECESLEVNCPNWKRFVMICAGGDLEVYKYLKKAAAYSILTGDISEQKVFCLLGAGRNGKSLFINTLAEIAGDYACKIDASLLCRNRFDEQNSDTAKELFRIKGCRFLYSNEFGSSNTLNEAFIKAITDGGKLTARQLYSSAIEYVPTYTLWFSTNHMPHLQTIDEGIRRRIVVIPFPIQISEEHIDRTLADKFRAEFDSILIWLLEGYGSYLTDGLNPPEAIQKATNAYFEAQDVFLCFLKEHYRIDPDGKIAARTLYQHYQGWCAENGEKSVSNNKFSAELQRLGVKKRRAKSGIFYELRENA